MRLEWSLSAIADREVIFDFIAADNPRAAASNDDRLRDHVNNLADFPMSGRPGRLPGTRELVVSGTPYIAAYRITGDLVFVLRVIHAAQRWPEAL